MIRSWTVLCLLALAAPLAGCAASNANLADDEPVGEMAKPRPPAAVASKTDQPPKDSIWTVARKKSPRQLFLVGSDICSFGREVGNDQANGADTALFQAQLAVAAKLNVGIDKLDDQEHRSWKWNHADRLTHDAVYCLTATAEQRRQAGAIPREVPIANPLPDAEPAVLAKNDRPADVPPEPAKPAKSKPPKRQQRPASREPSAPPVPPSPPAVAHEAPSPAPTAPTPPPAAVAERPQPPKAPEPPAAAPPPPAVRAPIADAPPPAPKPSAVAAMPVSKPAPRPLADARHAALALGQYWQIAEAAEPGSYFLMSDKVCAMGRTEISSPDQADSGNSLALALAAGRVYLGLKQTGHAVAGPDAVLDLPNGVYRRRSDDGLAVEALVCVTANRVLADNR